MTEGWSTDDSGRAETEVPMSRRRFVETGAAIAGAAATAATWPASAQGGWSLPTPGPVRMIENAWIGLTDGERLAVQLWIPQDASARPVPVVLEYIPYRKRDAYRAYDLYWGRQLAQYGIAYARLDTRGSGDSSGVLTDEYLPQEHQDAAEAIAWLAGQPWCNGAVGMRGVSWGGFSTLQAAALAPPALKAIMPMCASDMRYTDDAHYIGGALGLTDLKWAASFKVVMAAPPDPEITGPEWEKEWRRRLDATPPIAATWLRRQRNDAYWLQGSVAADYAAIRCPVYVVGGLVDAYGNQIPRLLAGLSAPRKALIGPWKHGYPSPASPGPGLGWAYEEVRWWDQWLNGADTGIMEEPMMRVFMPDRTASQTKGAAIPGRWIAESSWPTPRVTPKVLRLNGGGVLSADPAPETTVRYVADKVVGLTKAEWVPFAVSELPGEQTPDDNLSLIFDTAPLDETLEILGNPRATIRIAADQPVAKLTVRLTEVTPDGRSWLVTYGLLNLTHRHSHTHPTPLTPGRAQDVEITLSFIAHRFQKGSRIRVALSEGLWPLVWPSPRIPVLEISLGASRLALPVRAPPAAEAAFPIPISPPSAPGPDGGPIVDIVQAADGAVDFNARWPVSSGVVADVGTRHTSSGPDAQLSIRPGDPNGCVWRVTQRARYQRNDWDCAVESLVELRSTESEFILIENLTALRDGKVVFEREHPARIARDLM
jgi:putative CocE/NonD family hydrolase